MVQLLKCVVQVARTIGLFAVITLTVQPASACRVRLSEEQRVSNAYRRDDVAAVMLVRVDEAAYTSEQSFDAHPWRALATADHILRGAYSGGQVAFYGGLGSTACDLGYSMPIAGEEWIVYVSKGDGRVWNAFPKQVAFRADPSIRER
jgi:hypothetical protein